MTESCVSVNDGAFEVREDSEVAGVKVLMVEGLSS